MNKEEIISLLKSEGKEKELLFLASIRCFSPDCNEINHKNQRKSAS